MLYIHTRSLSLWIDTCRDRERGYCKAQHSNHYMLVHPLINMFQRFHRLEDWIWTDLKVLGEHMLPEEKLHELSKLVVPGKPGLCTVSIPDPLSFTVLNVGIFSGMIHWLTIKQIIPATPSNPSIPYVKFSTSKKKAGKRVATMEREMIGISFGLWWWDSPNFMSLSHHQKWMQFFHPQINGRSSVS